MVCGSLGYKTGNSGKTLHGVMQIFFASSKVSLPTWVIARVLIGTWFLTVAKPSCLLVARFDSLVVCSYPNLQGGFSINHRRFYLEKVSTPWIVDYSIKLNAFITII